MDALALLNRYYEHANRRVPVYGLYDAAGNLLTWSTTRRGKRKLSKHADEGCEVRLIKRPRA